jgi:hypothetical protein
MEGTYRIKEEPQVDGEPRRFTWRLIATDADGTQVEVATSGRFTQRQRAILYDSIERCKAIAAAAQVEGEVPTE